MTQENESLCGHCGAFIEDHDRAYLAETCYPIRISKLEVIIDQDKQAIRELVEWLIDNGEYTRECIWSRCDAGRPAESGGYENKFIGKWYQSRPVDELPQCPCELHKLISKYSPEKK